MTRLDFSVNAALVLSHVALAMGDRVGLLIFAGDVESYLPPDHGRRQLSLILESLSAAPSSRSEASFSAAYLAIRSRLRKRALLLFLTEFLDAETAGAAQTYFRLMGRHHLCACAVVGDPEVTAWARTTPMATDEVYRQASALASLHDRERVFSLLRDTGTQVIDTLPETVSGDIVRRYLMIKTTGLL